MKKSLPVAFIFIISLALYACNSDNKPGHTTGARGHIVISSINPSYFEYENGTPYIPIGINMIAPGGSQNPDSALIIYEQWMKNLSGNGGNYFRVWLSSPFWDIEDQKAGEFREEKAQRIDKLISLASRYDLRIKMTLEHFRSLTMEENPQQWAVKSVYHISNGGPLKDCREYLSLPEGKKLFLDKIDFYRNRYGSDTLFFGWELWNEMNALSGPQDSLFFAWNEQRLSEVKKRFPENLVMQSLGSFDTEKVDELYKQMMLLPGNQVAQVHRYLDLGAPLETCHMPMDVICSSAVEKLRSYNTGKPVILAETGAVEPRHSGPSKLYPSDTAGILLHDILFAPFFSGAAGAGMSWHWDSYVAKNNLWYHFGRFSEAIKGINPVKENFRVSRTETDEFRVYILNGNSTTLIWLRDKSNNWETELRDGIQPSLLTGINLDLKAAGLAVEKGDVEFYDPWQDKWKDGKIRKESVSLPDFKRSLIVKITPAAH
ncbi:MAG TPA: hypothetical protein VK207_00930 [Bacteroidales bacterium]|nr:hypothetical protein [Bacteroidales bacterium]